jgi:DNA/RNA endonuclease YhcR with UshA esterase domain
MKSPSSLFLIITLASVVASGSLIAETLTPEEAKNHGGEVATVTGRVVEFRTISGEAFLDMGKRHPKETFTVFCAPETRISRKTLSRFEGKTISVTGKIELYQDRPEIVLTSLDQIVKR